MVSDPTRMSKPYSIRTKKKSVLTALSSVDLESFVDVSMGATQKN